jgi:hypothetical protein
MIFSEAGSILVVFFLDEFNDQGAEVRPLMEARLTEPSINLLLGFRILA